MRVRIEQAVACAQLHFAATVSGICEEGSAAAANGQTQQQTYDEAVREAEAGNYEVALQMFSDLGSFGDSEKQLHYYSGRKYAAERKYGLATREFYFDTDFRDSCEQIDAINMQVRRILESRPLMRDWENGKVGFRDAMGRNVLPHEWDTALTFGDGLALVTNNDQTGFINTKGELVISCAWDDVMFFSEGLAAVQQDDHWGYIDTSGELVIPCQWESTLHFDNGLAWVKKDGRYGYINTEGELVIPCRWEWVGSFSEGLADVQMDYLWGFIDTQGELVIPCEWDHVDEFQDGLAYVELSAAFGYIDASGTRVGGMIPF